MIERFRRSRLVLLSLVGSTGFFSGCGAPQGIGRTFCDALTPLGQALGGYKMKQSEQSVTYELPPAEKDATNSYFVTTK